MKAELNGQSEQTWADHAFRRAGKALLFIFSLFLFILAITLMKEGAHSLTPLVRDIFRATSPVHSLGFGWLFAYVVMSGSPVAAVALTFLDAGALTPLSTFTMITGSRLGSNFVVILLGLIYVWRGYNRASSLDMGLISFSITASTHFVGLFIGLALLASGMLDQVSIGSGMRLQSVFTVIFDPITNWLARSLPPWGLFATGLGLIIFSFSLFDRCLPEMTLKESQLGRVSRLVYSPWIMLTLGGALTLLSMSVSVSLSILVPLSNRGFIRRENVIPYIMGANVTTFIDTLLASMLMDNPAAPSVVLAEMLSIVIVSAIILTFFYRPYERWILSFVAWCTTSDRNLVIFACSLVGIPLMLLFV